MDQPNFGHNAHTSPGMFIDAWGDGPMRLRYKGKTWRFEFSQMFGPLLLNATGEVAKRQPEHEKHSFWEPFNKWLDGGKRCRAVRTKRGKLLFWLCHIPHPMTRPDEKGRL